MLARIIAVLLALALYAGVVHAVPESFPSSVAAVLQSEGSAYTNIPADPGGPTKWGVTLRDVRSFMKANATAADVKVLTRDQAVSIYHDKYWQHHCVRADALPAGLDYSTFDYGVNAGVGRSGVVLRRLLGVNADRCDVTDALVALLAQKDAPALIRAMGAERKRFYANLIAARPSLGIFRNGWMKRADAVERIALKMAGTPALGLFGEELEAEPAFGPGKAYQPGLEVNP